MSLVISNSDKDTADSEAAGSSSSSAPTIGTSEAEMQLEALISAIQSAVDMGSTSTAVVSGTLTRSDGTPISRAGIFSVLKARLITASQLLNRTESLPTMKGVSNSTV